MDQCHRFIDNRIRSRTRATPSLGWRWAYAAPPKIIISRYCGISGARQRWIIQFNFYKCSADLAIVNPINRIKQMCICSHIFRWRINGTVRNQTTDSMWKYVCAQAYRVNWMLGAGESEKKKESQKRMGMRNRRQKGTNASTLVHWINIKCALTAPITCNVPKTSGK